MKSLMHLIIYSTALLFLCIQVQAQNRLFDHITLGGQFHYGSFLTSEPKAVYVRDSYTYFGELNFQQVAEKAGRPNRPVPHWGAGLFFGHTGSKKYIGKMAGAFSFINLPLLRYRGFQSNIRLGAGLGWVEKPYNKISNHKNVIIGTPVNGYMNALWQNEWPITKDVTMNAGLSFSHLSNGTSTLPNLGLNIPAFSIGFRYNSYYKVEKSQMHKDSISKKWNLLAYTSAGVKQAPWIESKRYIVNIFNLEATKAFSFRSRLGGGAFLFYDPSLVIDIDLEDQMTLKRDISQLQAGFYGTYEFTVGKLLLPLQIGIPILNSKARPALFQQIGIRYQIKKSWQAQALLKSYGGKADVIHLGIGYKIL